MWSCSNRKSLQLRIVLAISTLATTADSGGCPADRWYARDVFGHPGSFLSLKCGDEGDERPQNLRWGFNPKFGENWRKTKGFNFTSSWTFSPSHSGIPPLVNSVGNLVLGEMSLDRKWMGEFLCVFDCGGASPVTRKQVFWVTVYEPLKEAPWSLKALWGSVVGMFLLCVIYGIFCTNGTFLSRYSPFNQRQHYTGC